ASTALSPATGMNGMKTTPDILVDNIEVEDFDAIVFVGGSGAMQHLDDVLFHRVARDAVAFDKLIGAICIAPAILAKAGILQGRNATVYPSGVDYLKECSASYTGRPVETDGDIITASGPDAAKEFGQALVKALNR
ncbi:MAG: DJ-1/PfpI family protein, partial [Deltaproteobacteria bacterium]|nr:DJ-1/PfpI family protein [Deltaproteobacteria bacterium]